MARVFCENCGRQHRAVEAVGAYEGTPYCEACKNTDKIPEQDFVRFGGQSSAPDAAPRSQVAPRQAAAPSGGGETPESILSTAKHRCVDCGAILRIRQGTPRRRQCRICESKARGKMVVVSVQKSPNVVTVNAVPKAPQVVRAIAREVLQERQKSLVLLTDDDYEKLKPRADHNDLSRQLLAQIGMIVAVRGPKQGRLKLDAKKGDSRNLACRIRRLLRNEKITAEVESFTKSSCVVVSVGYGKQAK